jgi:hypothetical protein
VNVELKVKDTTSYEPHIVVCDQFRCYVFLRGGKLEHEFHLLHLKSIHSISKTEVTLSWQLPSANKITSVTIHPVCYASSTVDTIVLWLLQHWRQNFVGTPDSERFTVELGPPHRSEALLKLDFIEDKEKDCGGYLYTYLAWNDYLNADPSPRIIWELKHYFYEQVVKVSTNKHPSHRVLSWAPFPPPFFIYSSLKGVTPSLAQLLQAVYENPNLHMERLSFTGNSFDN